MKMWVNCPKCERLSLATDKENGLVEVYCMNDICDRRSYYKKEDLLRRVESQAIERGIAKEFPLLYVEMDVSKFRKDQKIEEVKI